MRKTQSQFASSVLIFAAWRETKFLMFLYFAENLLYETFMPASRLSLCCYEHIRPEGSQNH
jgi:hypothetical protein